MLRDQFAESEPLVEFAHQDQATVRSDAGALELDLERGVEGELKGPILYLTMSTSDSRIVRSVSNASSSARAAVE
jgi:hypothetical protein